MNLRLFLSHNTSLNPLHCSLTVLGDGKGENAAGFMVRIFRRLGQLPLRLVRLRFHFTPVWSQRKFGFLRRLRLRNRPRSRFFRQGKCSPRSVHLDGDSANYGMKCVQFKNRGNGSRPGHLYTSKTREEVLPTSEYELHGNIISRL